MKTLKQLAIAALICYGSAAMAMEDTSFLHSYERVDYDYNCNRINHLLLSLERPDRTPSQMESLERLRRDIKKDINAIIRITTLFRNSANPVEKERLDKKIEAYRQLLDQISNNQLATNPRQ